MLNSKQCVVVARMCYSKALGQLLHFYSDPACLHTDHCNKAQTILLTTGKQNSFGMKCLFNVVHYLGVSEGKCRFVCTSSSVCCVGDVHYWGSEVPLYWSSCLNKH